VQKPQNSFPFPAILTAQKVAAAHTSTASPLQKSSKFVAKFTDDILIPSEETRTGLST
jgi:hypothetical protein